MITPAHVQQAFAQEQVVRYPHGASLCDARSCTGVEFWGGGIVAFLAPRSHPQYELIVLKTPAEAKKLLAILHGARRRENVVLYAKARLPRIFRIFSTL